MYSPLHTVREYLLLPSTSEDPSHLSIPRIAVRAASLPIFTSSSVLRSQSPAGDRRLTNLQGCMQPNLYGEYEPFNHPHPPCTACKIYWIGSIWLSNMATERSPSEICLPSRICPHSLQERNKVSAAWARVGDSSSLPPRVSGYSRSDLLPWRQRQIRGRWREDRADPASDEQLAQHETFLQD